MAERRTKGGGRDVSIYELTSPNGTDWTLANGGRPVLEPGGHGDFDSYGVETPAVIRVGGTYHMYYTAYAEPPSRVYYTMGHWLLWYAGDSFDPDHKPGNMLAALRSGTLRMGIGMVTSEH